MHNTTSKHHSTNQVSMWPMHTHISQPTLPRRSPTYHHLQCPLSYAFRPSDRNEGWGLRPKSVSRSPRRYHIPLALLLGPRTSSVRRFLTHTVIIIRVPASCLRRSIFALLRHQRRRFLYREARQRQQEVPME